MSDTRIPSTSQRTLTDSVPDHRPGDRFWPYVDVPEEPTDQELAALDPDLHDALFGRTERPFSITVSFLAFDGDDYLRAVNMARDASEYQTVGSGDVLRHRARFYPDEAVRLRELFVLVDATEGCEVLIDDRPVPYARELWLPLVWFLLFK